VSEHRRGKEQVADLVALDDQDFHAPEHGSINDAARDTAPAGLRPAKKEL
jgi:hypothetical protein